MKKNIFILGLLLMQVFAFGQTLDASFGVGGKVVMPIGIHGGFLTSIQQQTDGKIVATGLSKYYDTPSNESEKTFVSRFNTDGSLDNSFGNNGIVFLTYTMVRAENSKIKLQNDGKILIATNEEMINSESNFLLARLNSDGSYDQSFGTNGIVITNFGTNINSKDVDRSIELQADNKIILAGYSENNFLSQNNNFVVARYNIDGSLDNTFGNNGKVEINIGLSLLNLNSQDIINSVKFQSNGKIILGGYTDAGNTVEVSNSILMRLNTDGSIDSTFGINGMVITNLGGDGRVINILITNEDKIITCNAISFSTDNSIKIGLVKYEANGALDNTFGNNGNVITQLNNTFMLDIVSDSALQADNKIIVFGTMIQDTDDMFIARYTVNGNLDPTFGNDGFLLTDFGLNFDLAFSILVQSNGKIVAGGASYMNQNYDLAMARYTFEDLNVIDSNNQFYSLYPNPAKQSLNLKTSQRVESISIVDVSGKIVFIQNNNLETIDVSKLAKGIYFLNANIEGKIVVEKFIKE